MSVKVFKGFLMHIGQTQTSLFVFLATCIGLLFHFLSGRLVKQLSEEEREKMEVWARASESVSSNEATADMLLVLRILQGNKTIPVILYDEQSGRMESHNIKLPDKDTVAFLHQRMKQFAERHEPLLLSEANQKLYFDDSHTLKRLRIYPCLQLFMVALFIGLAFFALNRSQRAEQNSVWVGLSKETAHQLGTPISSLMAWTEYLRLKEVDAALLKEVEKDTDRLQMIAERFSKIGSKPDMQPTDVGEAVKYTLGYLEKRLSNRISYSLRFPQQPIRASLNEPLFGWVIENLTKNAADAMKGEGVITYELTEKGDWAVLDISDTGKGMTGLQGRRVFTPGFTTKKGGWGLGLSLARRIVEVNHNGRILLLRSEPGRGSTFRIMLRR